MNATVHKIIEKRSPSLSLMSRRAILDLCEECNIKKEEIFIEKGKTNNYEYFLLEGIARSYLMNQDGENITLSFFEDLSILSPHVTRTHNKRSLINIAAISDCRLVRLDAGSFEKLMEDNLEVREFANIVLRNELFQKINKEIRLISWSGKERLEQFRKDYHMLENLVPHSMIASYLGITNVSLSRLRKQP